jgi:NADPH2:quinone reductase
MHPGAYQAVRLVPAARTVKLPPGMTAEVAAATLLRGLTAQYLLNELFVVRPGQDILVHAAAGGMGAVLCPWAKALGARVIGTVGSSAKVATARTYGCDEVIDYSTEDFAERTLALTGGRGVAVVYDAVGRDVFLRSLDCLAPKGMAINYGAASGPVGEFDIQLLHHKSLVVARPTLRTYTATSQDLNAGAQAFFKIVASGAAPLAVAHAYPFADVRQAHADLEGRRTTGACILVP